MKFFERFDREFWSFRNPIIWGVFFTFCVFGVYYFLAIQRSCQKGVCQTNLKHFVASSPNEIGDTLAGIAGILAFLWIIVTVFMQNKELRAQRLEFREQRKATQEMAASMATQSLLFEDEKLSRSQQQASSLVNEHIKRIKYWMQEIERVSLFNEDLAYFAAKIDYENEIVMSQSYLHFLCAAGDGGLLEVEKFEDNIEERTVLEFVDEILNELKAVVAVKKQLSPSEMKRLENNGFEILIRRSEIVCYEYHNWRREKGIIA